MVEPMSAKKMRDFCGQKDATYFKANVIDPLIAEGLVAMTQPNSPKSPSQKYYLTELGKELLADMSGTAGPGGRVPVSRNN